MTRTRYINGKFTAQATTGVQRVASRLVQALDRQADAGHGPWVLLCPPGGVAPALSRIECRTVGRPGEALHVWEQLRLPRAARGGRLVNLAGSAPWRAGDSACMIHDAAVFDHPEAYSLAFRSWYRLLFRHLVRRGARLMTVSAFSQQRLARALSVAPERLAVVVSGADHLRDVVADASVLDQHGLQPGRYLLAVGSANPTKNLDRLVAAHAALPIAASTPKLVIVGGRNARVFAGPAVAADHEGVLRAGHAGDAQLKALYEGARALVFPSIYEGFGLPPLEAMACGCPVLAARAASIPEVCGDAALYFDPLSTAAITQAMGRASHDDVLLQQLRQQGAAHAAAFTWAASAERLCAALAHEGAA